MDIPDGGTGAIQWRTRGSPELIECPREVFDSVQDGISRGFLSFPRGGVEVGGVFFGEVSGDVVRIRTWRPVHCDHASGPSFLLSKGDEARLRSLLDSSSSQEGLEGLKPVGWFHTHNRSDVGMTAEDTALHQRHFTEPWQFAVVFQPRYTAPTLAAIFRCRQDGEMASALDSLEFPPVADIRRSWREVEERNGNSRTRRAASREPFPTASEPQTASGHFERSAAAARADLERLQKDFSGTDEDLPPGEAVLSPLIPDSGLHPDDPAMPVAPAQVPPARVPERIWPTSSLLNAQPATRNKRTIWPWIAVPLLAGLIGAGVYYYPIWKQGRLSAQATETLALRLEEANGTLTVSWNPKAQPIVDASSADLRITDGGVARDMSLSREALLRGSVPYFPLTGDVVVRLHVNRSNGPAVEEAALFLGRSRPPAAAAAGGDSQQAATPEESPAPGGQTEVAKAEPVKPMAEDRRPREPVRSAQAVTLTQSPPIAPPVSQPPPDPAAALQQAAPALAQSGPLTGGTPSSNTAGRQQRGKIIWTGLLGPGQELAISGGKASAGSLSGSLPNGPFNVSVYPAEFASGGIVLFSGNSTYASGDTVEAPSAQNGWNRLTYTYSPERARTLQVPETPGAANNWQRLRVRSTGGSISTIVISWEAR